RFSRNWSSDVFSSDLVKPLYGINTKACLNSGNRKYQHQNDEKQQKNTCYFIYYFKCFFNTFLSYGFIKNALFDVGNVLFLRCLRINQINCFLTSIKKLFK